MGKFSQTTQQDLRTVIGEAGLALSPESFLAMPGSFAAQDLIGSTINYRTDVGPEITQMVTDILSTSNRTITDLLGITADALNGIFAAQQQTQEQAESTQLGEASVFNKWLPYLILAFLGYFLLVKR